MWRFIFLEKYVWLHNHDSFGLDHPSYGSEVVENSQSLVKIFLITAKCWTLDEDVIFGEFKAYTYR